MKKLLALLLVAVMVFAFIGCDNNTTVDGSEETDATTESTPAVDEAADYSKVKFGLICLHDENSTYDKNFIEGFKEAVANLGLSDSQVVIKTNIPESSDCYDAAVDLAEDGCNIIFANSFGHESFILQAAMEYPDVQFCHATGTMAHTENLDNFANAFASIYEGRYLAGIAAGMKLNEMMAADANVKPVMGYVGAYTYAEVVSGYTSFYLGAKSVCPDVTMKVQFTGSWYDEAAEKEAATKLIGEGCVLISQHADSMGAPTACEEAGVPNISYNGSTVASCPNTFIVSSRINWAPYYEYVVKTVTAGEKVAKDWTGTIATGSVVLTEVNEKAAAAGTADAIKTATEGLNAGTVNVFDASTFTVNGEALTSYMADVNTDAAYEKDTEAIENGVFYESKHRSAPYFDIQIDGITLLNSAF